MVSISRAAPAAANIRSVALMISGQMPSPWATVMGVFVNIREQLGYWNAPDRATGTSRSFGSTSTGRALAAGYARSPTSARGATLDDEGCTKFTGGSTGGRQRPPAQAPAN